MNGYGEELMPAKDFQRYAPATGAQHAEGVWRWSRSTDTFELDGSVGAIGKDYMPAAGVISSYEPKVVPQGHHSIDGYTLHLSYEGRRHDQRAVLLGRTTANSAAMPCYTPTASAG